jgi:hypothetical protein
MAKTLKITKLNFSMAIFVLGILSLLRPLAAKSIQDLEKLHTIEQIAPGQSPDQPSKEISLPKLPEFSLRGNPQLINAAPGMRGTAGIVEELEQEFSEVVGIPRKYFQFEIHPDMPANMSIEVHIEATAIGEKFKIHVSPDLLERISSDQAIDFIFFHEFGHKLEIRTTYDWTLKNSKLDPSLWKMAHELTSKGREHLSDAYAHLQMIRQQRGTAGGHETMVILEQLRQEAKNNSRLSSKEEKNWEFRKQLESSHPEPAERDRTLRMVEEHSAKTGLLDLQKNQSIKPVSSRMERVRTELFGPQFHQEVLERLHTFDRSFRAAIIPTIEDTLQKIKFIDPYDIGIKVLKPEIPWGKMEAEGLDLFNKAERDYKHLTLSGYFNGYDKIIAPIVETDLPIRSRMDIGNLHATLRNLYFKYRATNVEEERSSSLKKLKYYEEANVDLLRPLLRAVESYDESLKWAKYYSGYSNNTFEEALPYIETLVKKNGTAELLKFLNWSVDSVKFGFHRIYTFSETLSEIHTHWFYFIRFLPPTEFLIAYKALERFLSDLQSQSDRDDFQRMSLELNTYAPAFRELVAKLPVGSLSQEHLKFLLRHYNFFEPTVHRTQLAEHVSSEALAAFKSYEESLKTGELEAKQYSMLFDKVRSALETGKQSKMPEVATVITPAIEIILERLSAQASFLQGLPVPEKFRNAFHPTVTEDRSIQGLDTPSDVVSLFRDDIHISPELNKKLEAALDQYSEAAKQAFNLMRSLPEAEQINLYADGLSKSFGRNLQSIHQTGITSLCRDWKIWNDVHYNPEGFRERIIRIGLEAHSLGLFSDPNLDRFVESNRAEILAQTIGFHSIPFKNQRGVETENDRAQKKRAQKWGGNDPAILNRAIYLIWRKGYDTKDFRDLFPRARLDFQRVKAETMTYDDPYKYFEHALPHLNTAETIELRDMLIKGAIQWMQADFLSPQEFENIRSWLLRRTPGIDETPNEAKVCMEAVDQWARSQLDAGINPAYVYNSLGEALGQRALGTKSGSYPSSHDRMKRHDFKKEGSQFWAEQHHLWVHWRQMDDKEGRNHFIERMADQPEYYQLLTKYRAYLDLRSRTEFFSIAERSGAAALADAEEAGLLALRLNSATVPRVVDLPDQSTRWSYQFDPERRGRSYYHQIVSHRLSEKERDRLWRSYLEELRPPESYNEDLAVGSIMATSGGSLPERVKRADEVAKLFQLNVEQSISLRDRLINNSGEGLSAAYAMFEVFNATVLSDLTGPREAAELLQWLRGYQRSEPPITKEIVANCATYLEEKIKQNDNLKGDGAKFIEKAKQEVKGGTILDQTVFFLKNRLRETFRNSGSEIRAIAFASLISNPKGTGLLDSPNGRALFSDLVLDGAQIQNKEISEDILFSMMDAYGTNKDVFAMSLIGALDFKDVGHANEMIDEGERAARALENRGGLLIKIGQQLGADPEVIHDRSFRRKLLRLNDHADEPMWIHYLKAVKEKLGTEWEKVDRLGRIKGSGSVNIVGEIWMKDGRKRVIRIIRDRPDVAARNEANRMTSFTNNLRQRASSSKDLKRTNALTSLADALDDYVQPTTQVMQREGNYRYENGLSEMLAPTYANTYGDLKIETSLVFHDQNDIRFADTDSPAGADPSGTALFHSIESLNFSDLSAEEFARCAEAIMRTEIRGIRSGVFDGDGHLGNWLITREQNGWIRLHRIDWSQGTKFQSSQTRDNYLAVVQGLWRRGNPIVAGALGASHIDSKNLAEKFTDLLVSELDRTETMRLAERAMQQSELGDNPIESIQILKRRMNELNGNRVVALKDEVFAANKSLHTLQQYRDPSISDLPTRIRSQLDRRFIQSFGAEILGLSKIKAQALSFGSFLRSPATEKMKSTERFEFRRVLNETYRGLKGDDDLTALEQRLENEDIPRDHAIDILEDALMNHAMDEYLQAEVLLTLYKLDPTIISRVAQHSQLSRHTAFHLLHICSMEGDFRPFTEWVLGGKNQLERINLLLRENNEHLLHDARIHLPRSHFRDLDSKIENRIESAEIQELISTVKLSSQYSGSEELFPKTIAKAREELRKRLQDWWRSSDNWTIQSIKSEDHGPGTALLVFGIQGILENYSHVVGFYKKLGAEAVASISNTSNENMTPERLRPLVDFLEMFPTIEWHAQASYGNRDSHGRVNGFLKIDRELIQIMNDVLGSPNFKKALEKVHSDARNAVNMEYWESTKIYHNALKYYSDEELLSLRAEHPKESERIDYIFAERKSEKRLDSPDNPLTSENATGYLQGRSGNYFLTKAARLSNHDLWEIVIEAIREHRKKRDENKHSDTRDEWQRHQEEQFQQQINQLAKSYPPESEDHLYYLDLPSEVRNAMKWTMLSRKVSAGESAEELLKALREISITPLDMHQNFKHAIMSLIEKLDPNLLATSLRFEHPHLITRAIQELGKKRDRYSGRLGSRIADHRLKILSEKLAEIQIAQTQPTSAHKERFNVIGGQVGLIPSGCAKAIGKLASPG